MVHDTFTLFDIAQIFYCKQEGKENLFFVLIIAAPYKKILLNACRNMQKDMKDFPQIKTKMSTCEKLTSDINIIGRY